MQTDSEIYIIVEKRLKKKRKKPQRRKSKKSIKCNDNILWVICNSKSYESLGNQEKFFMIVLAGSVLLYFLHNKKFDTELSVVEISIILKYGKI